MAITNGWNDCGNNSINYPNGAYQGDVNANCYYTWPGYPYYQYPNGYYNGPYMPTQYLTYPIYQTDPKIIELLEAIKQLLESTKIKHK